MLLFQLFVNIGMNAGDHAHYRRDGLALSLAASSMLSLLAWGSCTINAQARDVGPQGAADHFFH